LVVIGDKALKAKVEVVCPFPPLAIANVPPIVNVPELVIAPPVKVNPVVPPEPETEVTVPAFGVTQLVVATAPDGAVELKTCPAAGAVVGRSYVIEAPGFVPLKV
jgi:hypothetical protein